MRGGRQRVHFSLILPPLPPFAPPRHSLHVWSRLASRSIPPRDAAALACVLVNAAKAYREGRWPRTVRVKRSGAVLEPASGTFDVVAAPGQGVQAAVDACPRGGSVLLLPGTHEGPLVLAADQEVHVFGRGLATLRTAAGAALTSSAAKATTDGLVIRREGEPPPGPEGEDEVPHELRCGVFIWGGALRLQACDVSSTAGYSVLIEGAGADPVLTECK